MNSKIQINPFIVAGKIPGEYFCDRIEESRRLLREVTNGSNLLLISPRRMGKTGLIQHCFDNPVIASDYDTYYIDILQTSSLKEFTYLLGREVFNRLAPRSEIGLKKFVAVLRSISGSFGFDPLTGLPTFDLQIGNIAAPEITLEEIFRYLSESNSKSVIAIDEFQQIANYKDVTNVEALLRSHIQRLSSTRFIFAGSERHMLQQMFADSARPFYNSTSVLELDAIAPDVYFNFASDLFAAAGKSLERDALNVVYEAVEGNTFYLQKAFNLAFSMTPRDGTCNVATVTSAIEDILASFDTIFRELLSRVGEAQKRVLLAIAHEGAADGVMSAKFVRKYSLDSASSVQSAIKNLAGRGLVTRFGNKYNVQDPLMRLWLLLNYGSKNLRVLLNEL